MDRTTIIGFVLIGLVLMVWMWMTAPPPQPIVRSDKDTIVAQSAIKDSLPFIGKPTDPAAKPADSLGKFFNTLVSAKEEFLDIEGGLFDVRLSSKGASIVSWKLKEFLTWDKHTVDLINQNSAGDPHLLFYSSDGKLINTKDLHFSFSNGAFSRISLTSKDSVRVEMVLNVSERARIVKSILFRNDSYAAELSYRFENMQDIISNFEYQVAWESGLRFVEHNSIDEAEFAAAFAYSGGELIEIDASTVNESVQENLSGTIDWVGTRSKYFSVAIVPRQTETRGAFLEGVRLARPNNGAYEAYSIALKIPFLGKSSETASFTIFAGPLEYNIVEDLGVKLEEMISLGAAWIIRPISVYVMIPLFQFLHWFIPNYGIVIIVFSFIIKFALYPLTKTSMASMRKMQALQPMMEEIRTKHKDDPQKMNTQIMKLYKEYGVNPAGGCLPLLLQMPILYALWSVFRSAIELRQANFVWWINDLSIPDVITKLPFQIPIFAIDQISGLALLMGITMFVQQKMTVKDPRQKMMVWMMPILMTLLFNSFPSGLNLYYFVFNLLSIGQQAWFNKQHKDEPLRKVEERQKTGGIFNRLAKDLPKLRK